MFKSSNVKIDQKKETQDLLKDMKNNPEKYKETAKQILIALGSVAVIGAFVSASVVVALVSTMLIGPELTALGAGVVAINSLANWLEEEEKKEARKEISDKYKAKTSAENKLKRAISQNT